MHDAYLILCHDNPTQVNALSACLEAAGHDVYIHLDAGSMTDDCIRQTKHIRMLPEPEFVRWGSWSICAATLKLMRAVQHSGETYRYVHLLSGQCLPAKPMEQLDAALDAAALKGEQFIEVNSIEPEPGCWEDSSTLTRRVKVYYPTCMVDKGDRAHRLIWWYAYKWKRLRLCRPSYYLFHPFFYGSQWWSLTGDCVAALLDYIARHPFMEYYFHHTFCPDELFIQTCIMRTAFASKVVGCNKRFLKWPRQGAASPSVLGPSDWAEVRRRDCFFARKFALDEAGCAAYFGHLR